MIECLILGDSIAVGTHMFKPECAAIAKGGINSKQWLDKNVGQSPYIAKTVIISLGSNDHKYIKTESELESIRQLTKADRVYWILPAGNLKASEVNIQDVQNIVRKIASKYGDTVLPITRLQPDGIHPSWAGYKDIVEKSK